MNKIIRKVRQLQKKNQTTLVLNSFIFWEPFSIDGLSSKFDFPLQFNECMKISLPWLHNTWDEIRWFGVLIRPNWGTSRITNLPLNKNEVKQEAGLLLTSIGVILNEQLEKLNSFI